MMESERIWTAEMQKAQPPCCFLLKKGMRKVLSKTKYHLKKSAET